jgi:hypothetical protein
MFGFTRASRASLAPPITPQANPPPFMSGRQCETEKRGRPKTASLKQSRQRLLLGSFFSLDGRGFALQIFFAAVFLDGFVVLFTHMSLLYSLIAILCG